MLVCKDKILEKLILELRRGGKVLSIWSHLRFQAYQIKVESLAVDNTLHDVGEIRFATTSE